MTRPRFYSSDITITSIEAVLTNDEFHHLKNVLRLTPGASIEIFNGKGLLKKGVLEKIEKKRATVTLAQEPVLVATESQLEITLMQGLLKGDKNEFVIREATALGVKGIRFFTTNRTIGKVDEKKKSDKLVRWKKAAIEAAKQCGRITLPEITGPEAINASLSFSDKSLQIALYEAEEEVSLREVLKGHCEGEEVVILIGPEGGLSKEDIELLKGQGFKTARMGPRKLRSETAQAAALSIVQYELGDLA